MIFEVIINLLFLLMIGRLKYSIMAVSTRSKRTLVSKTVISEVKVLDKADVVKKTVKKVASPKKAVGSGNTKFDLEDELKHMVVPSDLSLPMPFTEYHNKEFITGVHHILSIDPSLYPVIVFKNFPHFRANGTVDESKTESQILEQYWYSLISSIISQQVSGAAAASIERKFNILFDPLPRATPALVLTKSHDELRGAGLSNKKVEYVQHISEHFVDSSTNKLAQLEFYKTSTDEEIMEELVSLKGIGPWSAKMFMTFTLKRYNIFAHDDLGVARGAYRYLNRRKHILDKIILDTKQDEALLKLLSKKSKFASSKGKRDWTPYHDVYIGELGKEFSPYQLIVMMILWRLSSINMDVLEGAEAKKEKDEEKNN